jgi:putative membrane-bound dehydrogenase-like protein
LWVIQYLQYPTPAGLKPVSVDQYLRTKYDRVPEPPPHGPKGADRITICEDFDGSGRPRKFKDFVSGLNLCSGMEIGYGGVFVLQPPYLLFYADRNRDDVPDGDPEVLLTGFGMEDAHAVANSLTWGPDGWLYGAQGSTVTANIRGIEFQQGIWRYHPRTKEFEVFAEGGGNTWGLDFDENGEILAGTNFEESKMLHQVQGGYYIKNFGKHGELHNPHAYGYFGHVPYSGYRGLHISSGGIVYQGGSYPPEFTGAYIFANVLDHAVYWANMRPQGSSFTASFGGALLKTSDEMFRPIDCTSGPDGAVYIADWCDKRASHVDPLDTWDRSKGRIYRVQSLTPRPLGQLPRSSIAGAGFDLERLSSNELVSLLSHPNDWFEREARRILAERRDTRVAARLRSQLFSPKDSRLALRSLWALYVSGGMDDSLAARLLTHLVANIRAWTVRLLGDKREVSASIGRQFAVLARQDPSPIVRRQLACTAKRLRASDALPIINELLRRDEDVNDMNIPLLVWWALEDKAISSQSAVLKMFASVETWRRPLAKQFIIERLTQRYAAEGKDFGACTELLQKAPDSDSEQLVMAGMEKALAGQKFDKVPKPLEVWFAKAWASHSNETAYVRFGLRLGSAPAFEAALRRVGDESYSRAERESLIEVLGQTASPDCIPALLGIWERADSEKLRGAALEALQHFPDLRVADALVKTYPQSSAALRTRARNALCSRASWSMVLVTAVDDGRIDPKEISLEQVRKMAALKDEPLAKLIEKHWGKVQSVSPQEKRNSVNQLKLVLHPSGVVGRDAKGNRADGKKVFQQTCGTCHKLFEEGNSVGPDLTAADRKNTDYLLEQIVDPSAYIRPEYVSYEVETRNAQTITGLMVESTPAAVTLLDRNNERHLLPRAQIKELRESQVSLMPEGLLEALPPQSVMDLFAYLQGDTPLAGGSGR